MSRLTNINPPAPVCAIRHFDALNRGQVAGIVPEIRKRLLPVHVFMKRNVVFART